MSDFEIAGINSLKQALTQMGRSPKTISRRDPMVLKLMEEIYVEVRQARISGYSWKDLKSVINEKCKIKLNENSIATTSASRNTGCLSQNYPGRKDRRPRDNGTNN